MKASSRSRLRFISLLVVPVSVLVLTVACAQSGNTESGGALMSPSALSPGSSYDATGPWYGVITGDIGGSGTLALVQDSHGNISGEDDGGHVYTFKHQGPGDYKASVFSPAPCPTDVSGSAQLDALANTITAEVSGTAACLPNVLNFTITLTKL